MYRPDVARNFVARAGIKCETLNTEAIMAAKRTLEERKETITGEEREIIRIALCSVGADDDCD